MAFFKCKHSHQKTVLGRRSTIVHPEQQYHCRSWARYSQSKSVWSWIWSVLFRQSSQAVIRHAMINKWASMRMCDVTIAKIKVLEILYVPSFRHITSTEGKYGRSKASARTLIQSDVNLVIVSPSKLLKTLWLLKWILQWQERKKIMTHKSSS